ncbi:MAG TPA: biotin/lipoyl-containing protein, partial [Solirubrobacterales bacterium]
MSETTAVVVPMPHMGVSVEEGTVVEWHKQVGEEVAAEEVLCEIATDKVDTEVPAPADGVLAKILAEEGATVAVGEPLAELTVSTEAAAALEPAQGGEPSGPETVPSAPSAAPEPTAPSAASAAPEP